MCVCAQVVQRRRVVELLLRSALVEKVGRHIHRTRAIVNESNYSGCLLRAVLFNSEYTGCPKMSSRDTDILGHPGPRFIRV